MPVHYKEGQFPPDKRLDWQKLLPLVGAAMEQLVRFDGVLSTIPNRKLLQGRFIRQEAVSSSRIEGTQAGIDDLLKYEAGQEPGSSSMKRDLREVANYSAAISLAERKLQKHPLSLQILCDAHERLWHKVQGRNVSPGKFRIRQNWIGVPGSTVEDAVYVSISTKNLLGAMQQWEKYIDKKGTDRLVRLAILHAEFEALHPFEDGNGRVGRMLIPLFLWKKELLCAPVFHISRYLEEHKGEYFEKLLAVSRDDDWTGWCVFFLHAIQTQATHNFAVAKKIIKNFEVAREKVIKLTRSHYATDVMDWMADRWAFSSAEFINGVGVPKTTAQRILNKMIDGGLLRVMVPASGRRSAILVFGKDARYF